MNIKYVISFATIALLSIGVPGIISEATAAHAPGQVALAAVASLRPQVGLMPTAQVQSPLAPYNEVDDRDDNDNEQVNDQEDGASLKEEQEQADSANDLDMDNGQEVDQEDGQDASGADAEDDNDQDSQEATPVAQPVITAAVAQQAAEAYLKAGRASKVKLDNEDGQLVYEVRIGNTKVQVDARTSVVLSTKIDD